MSVEQETHTSSDSYSQGEWRVRGLRRVHLISHWLMQCLVLIHKPITGKSTELQLDPSWASGPITSWEIDGETVETVSDIIFGLQNHCRWWLQTWNKKTLAPWKESYDQSRHHIKKQRYYFANKGLSSQGYGFSSSRVWMWELDCEESWALKNWCFWTVVLEKTLESPWDCKEIQPVHPKGD